MKTPLSRLAASLTSMPTPSVEAGAETPDIVSDPEQFECGFGYREWSDLPHWNCQRCAISTFEHGKALICPRTSVPVIYPTDSKE
jgi:hypothetical protein